MSLISEQFLKDQWPDAPMRTTKPVKILGIADVLVSTTFIIFPLNFVASLDDGSTVVARIRVEAHIVLYLRVNLLLKIDNLGPKGAVIDYGKR